MVSSVFYEFIGTKILYHLRIFRTMEQKCGNVWCRTYICYIRISYDKIQNFTRKDLRPGHWPTYFNWRFQNIQKLNIIVNDDQEDAIILVYLFIPNQLYIFWAKSSPIIRNTWLFVQLMMLSTDISAGWCHGWDGTSVPSHPWHQPPAISVDNIISCTNSRVFLMMGEDFARNT